MDENKNMPEFKRCNKTVLIGTFIAVNTYVKKIKILSQQPKLKKLEKKKEQNKSIVSKWKEQIKNRIGISEKKMEKQKRKTMKPEAGSLKRSTELKNLQ